MEKSTESEYSISLMAMFTMDSGKTIRNQASAKLSTHLVPNLMGLGLMIKLKEEAVMSM